MFILPVSLSIYIEITIGVVNIVAHYGDLINRKKYEAALNHTINRVIMRANIYIYIYRLFWLYWRWRLFSVNYYICGLCLGMRPCECLVVVCCIREHIVLHPSFANLILFCVYCRSICYTFRFRLKLSCTWIFLGLKVY